MKFTRKKAVLLTAGLTLIFGSTAIRLFAHQGAQPPAATPATIETVNPMIGKPAPAFALPDQNDKTVALKDFKGKWLVVAFYPADMTSGCTFQNRSYTANREKFAPLNAAVVTVSTQNTDSKRTFCSKEGLKHTLLSDDGGKVATAYGIAMDNEKFGKIANRVTFYISPEGTIAAVDKKIRVQTAAEDSLAMLTKLQEKPAPTTATVVRRLGGPADTKVSLGNEVADFALTDVATGKTAAFTTLTAGKKANVIVFISTQCPVSNAYNERMSQVAAKYAKMGVQFIGINANRGETVDAVAAYAKQHELGFPGPQRQGQQRRRPLRGQCHPRSICHGR